MNRYACSGVAEDLRAGRRVAIVADTAMMAHAALREVLASVPVSEVTRMLRANGRGRIEVRSGGWARFFTAGSPNSLRGIECDVVYCDSSEAAQRCGDHLRLMVIGSPRGEVIRP